jgi:hypothetical protein
VKAERPGVLACGGRSLCGTAGSSGSASDGGMACGVERGWSERAVGSLTGLTNLNVAGCRNVTAEVLR